MNIALVTRDACEYRLELTSEAKALAKRITDPQDLNDALLAVRAEEMALKIANDARNHFEKQLTKGIL